MVFLNLKSIIVDDGTWRSTTLRRVPVIKYVNSLVILLSTYVYYILGNYSVIFEENEAFCI